MPGRSNVKKRPSSASKGRIVCSKVKSFDSRSDYYRVLGAALRVNIKSLVGPVPHAEESNIHKMLNDFITNGFSGRGRSELAKQATVPKDLVRKHFAVLAMVILTYDREWRHRFEDSTGIAERPLRLQYLDIDMADETPMPVLTQDAPEQLGFPCPIVDGIAPDGAVVVAMGPVAKSRGVLEPTKKLQSSSRYAMLLYDDGEDTYYSIGGETINPLQHLERTTAECL